MHCLSLSFCPFLPFSFPDSEEYWARGAPFCSTKLEFPAADLTYFFYLFETILTPLFSLFTGRLPFSRDEEGSDSSLPPASYWSASRKFSYLEHVSCASKSVKLQFFFRARFPSVTLALPDLFLFFPPFSLRPLSFLPLLLLPSFDFP